MTVTPAVECYSNLCCDCTGGGGGGTITGGLNLGAGSEVFAGVVGTDLTFRTLVSGVGMTINQTATELELISSGGFDPTANYTITGNWEFNAGFTIATPDAVSIQTDLNLDLISNTENVTISALTVGKQAQVYGDSLNLVGTDYVNLVANTTNVNINANNGTVNMGGGAIDIVAQTGNAGLRSDTGDVVITANNGNMSIFGDTATFAANTSMNIYTSNGGIQINTSTGNFNVFAGTGPTPGQINLGATDDINMNSTNGTVSMSGNGGAWSAGTAGITGGVTAGSGCVIDAVTGNVQFGAGTGTVLLGALANTVDIVAGTTLTLTAGDEFVVASTNDITITSSAGISNFNSTSFIFTGTVDFLVTVADVVNITTTGGSMSLQCAVQMNLLASIYALTPGSLPVSAANPGTPTNLPPVGVNYVGIDTTTGQLVQVTP